MRWTSSIHLYKTYYRLRFQAFFSWFEPKQFRKQLLNRMTKSLRIDVRKWRKLAPYAIVEIRYKIGNSISFEKKRISFGHIWLFVWILFVWIFLQQCSVYDIYIMLRYKNVCFDDYLNGALHVVIILINYLSNCTICLHQDYS